jgi:hypothetical protein
MSSMSIPVKYKSSNKESAMIVYFDTASRKWFFSEDRGNSWYSISKK